MSFKMSFLKKWLDHDVFIDEEQTDILKALFFYMKILHVWPRKGQNLRKRDICIFLLVVFPVPVILHAAEIIHIVISK